MQSLIPSFFRFLKRSVPCVLIALLLVFIFALPLSAHKVTIFAWVEGDMVYTESKFSGGRKAKNATVEVYDADGKKLLVGKTGENGDFAFKIPKKTALKVVFIAGMGHRGEWIIPLHEIAPGMSRLPAPDKRVNTESKKTGVNPQPVMQSSLTVEEIQSVIEKAMDRKLKPLMKLMAESRKHGPSVSDIFGGIGYIAGLVGVGVYFHFRKKEE